MDKGYFPTEQNNPDNVHDQKQETVFSFYAGHFFTKGGQIGQAQLDGLDAERYTDNGQAKGYPADDVTQGGDKAAEN